MKKKHSVEQDFNLAENRPLAGETRTFPLGQVLFFSPMPSPTARIAPGSWGESNQVVAINDTYMDIGQGNQGTAEQVQFVMSIVMGGFVFFLCVFIFMVHIGMSVNSDRTFFQESFRIYQEVGWIVLLGILLFACIGWFAVFKSMWLKAKTRPIRFHRQRREVCYYPDGHKTPVIAKWEDVVSWVSMHKGYTGGAVVTNATFGIAFPTEDGKEYWMLRRPVALVNEGQRLWEIIRCYMDEASEYWAEPAVQETRQTFDDARRQLHNNFKHGPKNKFFMELLDPSTSYAGMIGYYVYHILSFWKLPYWVAELDSKISMAKFPKEIETWSASLPQEQWVKPTEELLAHKAALNKHYQSGGEFTNFRQITA
jgi:hypothetical protein